MKNLWKFTEIAYLAIAVFFIVEAVLKYKTDFNKSMIFLAFAVVSILMYFFKKWFRKNRFEKRN